MSNGYELDEGRTVTTVDQGIKIKCNAIKFDKVVEWLAASLLPIVLFVANCVVFIVSCETVRCAALCCASLCFMLQLMPI